MTVEPKDVDTSEGLEPGWYAVVLCWDSEEGGWPSSAEWSGSEWKSEGEGRPDPIVSYWPIRFASEDDAEEFAHAQDVF